VSLLEAGNQWLEEQTKTPVLGVLPYLHNLHIEAEDAIAYQENKVGVDSNLFHATIKIIVPVLSRISNHTDFDALRLHPQVELIFIRAGQAIPSTELIIIPGTKVFVLIYNGYVKMAGNQRLPGICAMVVKSWAFVWLADAR